MTLALYGKSKRRQGGLLLGGLCAVMLAVLGGIAGMGGGQPVKADTASFPVASASCVDGNIFFFVVIETTDNDPTACNTASAAALGAGGATVNLETDDLANGFFNADLGTDDLTVNFNLASIPDGSTITAAAIKVWSTSSDAAGVVRVGSSGAGSEYGALAPSMTPASYSNAALVTAVTAALAGDAMSVRLSMDCNPNSDDCGALIDQVALDVTWTPATGTVTPSKIEVTSGPYAPGDEVVWKLQFDVSSTTAPNVFYKDFEPDGVTFTSLTDHTEVEVGRLGCFLSGGIVSCQMGNQADPGIYSINVHGTVDQDATCPGSITNNLNTNTIEGLGPVVASDTVQIECEEVGTVTPSKIEVTSGPYAPGDEVVWKLQFDVSSTTAPNVFYKDFEPDGVTFTSLTDHTEVEVGRLGCFLSGGIVSCQMGNQADPGIYSINVHGTVDQDATCPGSITNNLNTNTIEGLGPVVASDTVQIECDQEPSITFTKSNGALIDSSVQWTITFVNNGPPTTIDMSDTYEPNSTSTSINSIVYDSDQSEVLGCFESGSHWVGCNVVLPTGTTTLTVHTGIPSSRCEEQTVNNGVYAYLANGEFIGKHLGLTYVKPSTPQQCTKTIELCKVWAPNGPLNGATTFLFEASDSSEEIPATQNVSVPNVVEGDESGECILLSVSPGTINIAETVPAGFLTPNWTLGFSVGDNSLDDGTGASMSFHTGRCLIQEEDLLRDLSDLMRDIMNLVVEVQDSKPICTVTFYNEDDGITLNNGAIRIEKYLDLNGDGDANDPGEGLIDGWPINVAGPDAGIAGAHVTGEGAQDFGVLDFLGLVTNDVYVITEGMLPGYQVTRATLNGANQGAVTVVGAVVPNGGFTVVQFFNQPKGAILVHKVAVTSHNGGGDLVAPNDDDGWTITVSSANCNVLIVKQTDANGDALFEGLPLCTDYVVTESANNASSPGFVVVGASQFTGKTPTLDGATAVTFLNRKTTSDPPCTSGCTQSNPTPTPVTPVATPTTPAVAPTTPPAGNTPPVTQVAGERTPGASSTPIAPSTGDGLLPGATPGANLALLAAGILALASGLGVVALGRRR